MRMIRKEELAAYLAELHPGALGVFIDPGELVFEESVKMNCFYCGKYNNNWRCPPNLPAIDYRKLMGEYENGLFVALRYDIGEDADFSDIRNESSVTLHRLLLALEKWMWEHNCPTAISFIGGSCKLCKGGCGKERCNNPYMSRSPLEATGVQIIKSARRYGIDVAFPTDSKLMRIGLLLWQEMENEKENGGIA